MVVEGIDLHVDGILVSLVLSVIISWTFKILAHEENLYSYVYKYKANVLSKADWSWASGFGNSFSSYLLIYSISVLQSVVSLRLILKLL